MNYGCNAAAELQMIRAAVIWIFGLWGCRKCRIFEPEFDLVALPTRANLADAMCPVDRRVSCKWHWTMRHAIRFTFNARHFDTYWECVKLSTAINLQTREKVGNCSNKVDVKVILIALDSFQWRKQSWIHNLCYKELAEQFVLLSFWGLLNVKE